MIDIFSWIDKNIEQKLTVDDIVQMSGYSRRHLHNIFFRYSGKSVAEYIRLKKLKRTSIFLKLTKLTVMEISTKFNFDSPQTFSQVFKKYYNMSPIDYRKSAQWGKKVNFTDPCKLEGIFYSFVRKERTVFWGDKFYFNINISESGKHWSSAQKKIDQLRINSLLKNYANKAMASIAHFPCVKKNNFLTVEYIYGDDDFNKKGMQRVVIPSGFYLEVIKIGYINDFHEISNALYRDVLHELNVKKRDGYDYEEIKKISPDMFEYYYCIPVGI